jgi:hypothetical protein
VEWSPPCPSARFPTLASLPLRRQLNLGGAGSGDPLDLAGNPDSRFRQSFPGHGRTTRGGAEVPLRSPRTDPIPRLSAMPSRCAQSRPWRTKRRKAGLTGLTGPRCPLAKLCWATAMSNRDKPMRSLISRFHRCTLSLFAGSWTTRFPRADRATPPRTASCLVASLCNESPSCQGREEEEVSSRDENGTRRKMSDEGRSPWVARGRGVRGPTMLLYR